MRFDRGLQYMVFSKVVEHGGPFAGGEVTRMFLCVGSEKKLRFGYVGSNKRCMSAYVRGEIRHMLA